MNTIDNAREYATRILLLAPELKEQEEVQSLLFLAYLQGWRDAVKDELAYCQKLQGNGNGR
jgi:hypothetical protein